MFESVQGAAFLSHFVEAGIPWAHIDIAGVHSVDSDTWPFIKGPTGYGVRLLADWIAVQLSYCHSRGRSWVSPESAARRPASRISWASRLTCGEQKPSTGTLFSMQWSRYSGPLR